MDELNACVNADETGEKSARYSRTTKQLIETNKCGVFDWQQVAICRASQSMSNSIAARGRTLETERTSTKRLSPPMKMYNQN